MSMRGDITTSFADDSGPDDAKGIFQGIGLIAFLVLPLTILSAVITYMLFAYGRIHYKVIAGFIAVYGVILLAFGLGDNAAMSYLLSFTELTRIFDAFTVANVLSVVGTMMLMQAPLSIFVGGVIGTIRSWWAWFRRPVWKEYHFRKTPVQLWRKHRNIKAIRNDRNTPPDGRTIGVNENGDRVNQSEREGRAHTVVMGASGSGKTTTILNGCRDQIKRGEGLVFIDMKGSTDVPEVLAMYAKRYGRTFRHWTATETIDTYDGPAVDGPSYYDPLARGDATRKTNLMIAGRKWEGNAEHFKYIIQNYLQKAFEVINGTPELSSGDSFADILALLDPGALKKRSLNLKGNAQFTEIIQEIGLLADTRMDPQAKTTLNGMRSQYGALAQSIQGRWLKRDPEGKRDINLFDAAHNGEVVVFSVDSSNYEENSRILGNFIIQDLKTVSSELRHNKSRYPLNVIIDEFAAIGSDNIINLINKSRDAQMPVTLSTQSLGDLRTVSSAFMDQLTGIVSSFIIHRANGYDDAEVYASLTPRKKKQVFRQAVSHSVNIFGGIGKGSGTGKGTVDTVDAHLIDPSDVQNLRAGEAFYICKDPTRLERVQVYTEARNIADTANDGKANGAYDASQEIAPLLLNEGENLSDYTVEESENFRRSMEEQRKEEERFEAETHKSAQRRADPNVLKRLIGEEHINQMSVKPRTLNDGDIVVDEPVVIDTPALINDSEPALTSAQGVPSDDASYGVEEEEPVRTRPVRPTRSAEATVQESSGSTSWNAVKSTPGRPKSNIPPRKPVVPSRPKPVAVQEAPAVVASNESLLSVEDHEDDFFIESETHSMDFLEGLEPRDDDFLSDIEDQDEGLFGEISENDPVDAPARKKDLGLPDLDIGDDEYSELSVPDIYYDDKD